MALSLKQIIRNIFKILTRKEKRTLLYLLLLNTIVSVVDVASMVALVFVIAFYTESQQIVYASFLPQWLLQKGSLNLFIIFLFFLIIKNWMALLALQFQQRYVYMVALRISRQNLETYLDGDFETYIKTDSSVSIRKMIYHPLEFSQHILAGFQQIITEIILIILAVGVIAFYKATLFLVLFIILFPLIFLVSYIVKRKLKLARAHIKNSYEKALQFLQETLTGFVDVNIFNGKKFFVERFYAEQGKLGKYMPDLQVSQGMSSRYMEIFAISGLFLLFLANQYAGNQQTGIVLNIGAFVAAAYKIIPGIIKVLNLREQIMTFGFTTDNLASGGNDNARQLEQSPSIKSILFSNVAFSYHEKPVLLNCNIAILPGDFVGISGPSGKGKTTFINLLLGFLEEKDGNIFINGELTNALTRQRYWQHVAYVKQQTFLIHDTIRNNICFEAENVDNERLMNVIRVSGLDNLIKNIPEGVEKIINEDGKNISGGQRQRIAIARALYKKADVYILDEPFNELDNASEIVLLEYFKELAQKGSIIILVTHNKDSLSYCNKIVSVGQS